MAWVAACLGERTMASRGQTGPSHLPYTSALTHVCARCLPLQAGQSLSTLPLIDEVREGDGDGSPVLLLRDAKGGASSVGGDATNAPAV